MEEVKQDTQKEMEGKSKILSEGVGEIGEKVTDEIKPEDKPKSIELHISVDKSAVPYTFKLLAKPEFYEDFLVCMAILENHSKIETSMVARPDVPKVARVVKPDMIGGLKQNRPFFKKIFK